MRSHPNFAPRQRGAILIVSVLLLLVMTVLALTASQTTRLQERMAGNARDLDLAFQAGEAGLREAELRIEDVVAINAGRTLECAGDIRGCDVADRDSTAALDYAKKDVPWWGGNAFALGEDLAHIDVRPHYYSELWTEVQDTLSVDRPVQTGTAYYVNISRAQGATDTAVTLIESTYAVRYSRQSD